MVEITAGEIREKSFKEMMSRALSLYITCDKLKYVSVVVAGDVRADRLAEDNLSASDAEIVPSWGNSP